ncbi:hypothetical protein BsWGS_16002 [Bradybaena similaris]
MLGDYSLKGSNIVFLSDCASILQTIKNEPKDLLTRTTMELLNKLSTNNTLYYNGFLHTALLQETKQRIYWRKWESRRSNFGTKSH